MRGKWKGKKVGVLMGGRSSEREISLRTGEAVAGALRRRGYTVVAIDVDRNLARRLEEEGVEVAFVALHGRWGEDGTVQGLLEMMEIPYTGSGVGASALGMDKLLSRQIFIAQGLPVPRYELVHKGAESEIGGVLEKIGLPLVVKPRAEGSSIGVRIVTRKEELTSALDEAFSFGEQVLVEEYVEGQEIHVGILNQRVLGGVEVVPRRQFYDYQAKYTPGETRYLIPPPVDEHKREELYRVALEAYRSTGCDGPARVDTILSPKEGPVILEVNTVPGMTETSLLPKIAQAAGISYEELVEEIIEGASLKT